MSDFNTPDLQASLSKVMLGFVGTIAAFFLLPKTLKFVIRRFLVGVIGEVIAIVLAGLLTEKAVDKLGKH